MSIENGLTVVKAPRIKMMIKCSRLVKVFFLKKFKGAWNYGIVLRINFVRISNFANDIETITDQSHVS